MPTSIFSNTNSISIPEGGVSAPYPSIINVSGTSGSLTKLTVTLTNLNHTWTNDLDVLLVSPTGAKSILMSDVGSDTGLTDVTLTFDATATSSLSDFDAISSGTYRPTNFDFDFDFDGFDDPDFFDSPAPEGPYNVDFSVFNGTNPNGEWRLYIVDDVDFDSGNVAGGWSLSIETLESIINGDDSNNTLEGNILDNTINGLGGNDSLNGGAGNDTLNGGAGTDTLIGGLGNDIYVVDSATDTITELVNAGTDTVQSSVTYTIAELANVENLTLTGTAAINGTGNAANNVITGNGANNTLDGGAGTDTLIGGLGNDIYIVDSATDTITELTSGGTDTVQSSVTYTIAANVENLTLTGTAAINGTGNAGNNVITGNGANNTLDGGAGTDTLIGGTGDDIYIVDSTTDTITENAIGGTDTVQSSVTYTIAANVENLTLTGTAAINGTGNAGNNVITGNSGNNTLDGGAGNDTLDGGAGTDTLIGGLGDDIYIVDIATDSITELANEGTDTIQSSFTYSIANKTNFENLTLTGTTAINGTGNASNNIIRGNSGDNTLNGGAGNDTLDGGAGTDTLIGGLGNDTLDGGAGIDALIGGTGDDIYIVDSNTDIIAENADEGTDTIQSSVTYSIANKTNFENLTLTGTAAINGTGNVANNVITGNSGNNTINGGAGNDTLDGGAGTDILIGGLGNDIYIVDSTTDTITENTIGGTDTIQSSVTYTIAELANVENLTLIGTTAINATGNAANNVITGNSGNNTINGGAGNDTLDGGAGTDTLIGGLGNDIYIVDSISDTITENVGEGTDTIKSSVTYTILAANVENLTLTGTAAINGTGNVGNNVITGNGANNTLDGGAGTDTLIGGLGNDIYVVDSATDTITELTSGGTDTIQSSVTYTIAELANVENLTLTGTAAVNGTGNAANNVITGNDANNTLDGRAGTDTLIGGLGNDIYVVDSATDTITENTNAGTDTIQSSVTYTIAALANVENLTLTGTAAINGTGNAANNVITGNGANNSLDGGAGNDTLDGGAGTDTLIGGTGDDIYIVDSTTDTITESANEGTDTIQSSVTYTIVAANVENLTLTGTTAINGTGNAANNVITGNSANNTLDGGAGTDTLIGGLGNDIYVVDSATDTITENTNAGTDTIQSSVTYTIAALANVENLTLTGTAAINGTGNAANNVITGNGANNTLDGGAGNDTLDGGAGTDTLIGGTGDDIYIVDSTTDTITESANEGTDTIQSSVTYTI
ncbi:beta strand repeat-containing protein, partial [Dolichospermum flos-aquae]